MITEGHSIPIQMRLIRNGRLRLRPSLHLVHHFRQYQGGCSVLQQEMIEHQLSKPPSRYLSLPFLVHWETLRDVI